MAELLIVVAIIAVLVAVAIPVFNNQLEKAREAVDLANLRDAYAIARTALLTEEYKDSSKWTSEGGVINSTWPEVIGGYQTCFDPAGGVTLDVSEVLGTGKAKEGEFDADNLDEYNLPDGVYYLGCPATDGYENENYIGIIVVPNTGEIFVLFASDYASGSIDSIFD